MFVVWHDGDIARLAGHLFENATLQVAAGSECFLVVQEVLLVERENDCIFIRRNQKIYFLASFELGVRLHIIIATVIKPRKQVALHLLQPFGVS